MSVTGKRNRPNGAFSFFFLPPLFQEHEDKKKEASRLNAIIFTSANGRQKCFPPRQGHSDLSNPPQTNRAILHDE